ncbi:YezD family protein [Verrucomicrobium sp. BvORR106]|uniref:YezD family protein n=1 Tax=Verrucomicrobium sp. BvORR106 TaxID=1403819 RepID=UPI00056F8D6D|nr:YezD family protein [Verrucomicrobium sp. BvORR106]
MSYSVENDLATEAWVEIVRRKVDAMRFGSVQIVVHEGRVTQVESTEKTRLPDAVNGGQASIKKRA